MAAKKGPAPKTYAKHPRVKISTPKENISSEGSLKIDDLTRLNLLRLDAEGRAAHQEMLMTQRELNDYLKGVDPAGHIFRLQKHIEAMLSKKTEMKNQFEALIKATGEKLQVDMTQISYDDETGIIHFPAAGPK
jgi:hypothetical protein